MSTTRRLVFTAAAVAGLSLLGSAQARAGTDCFGVNGKYVELR